MQKNVPAGPIALHELSFLLNTMHGPHMQRYADYKVKQ